MIWCANIQKEANNPSLPTIPVFFQEGQKYCFGCRPGSSLSTCRLTWFKTWGIIWLSTMFAVHLASMVRLSVTQSLSTLHFSLCDMCSGLLLDLQCQPWVKCTLYQCGWLCSLWPHTWLTNLPICSNTPMRSQQSCRGSIAVVTCIFCLLFLLFVSSILGPVELSSPW